MSTIKKWMADATPTQQEELARLAGTSRQYLYHLASDPDVRYHRKPTIELAVRLEEASRKVKPDPDGAKPFPLSRFELVPECASCPYANRKGK